MEKVTIVVEESVNKPQPPSDHVTDQQKPCYNGPLKDRPSIQAQRTAPASCPLGINFIGCACVAATNSSCQSTSRTRLFPKRVITNLIRVVRVDFCSEHKQPNVHSTPTHVEPVVGFNFIIAKFVKWGAEYLVNLFFFAIFVAIRPN